MANDRFTYEKKLNVRPGAGSLSAEEFESRPVLIAIKRALFERVNADRRAHGVGAIAYDRLAAEAGEAHCREMLSQGYVSHWNTRGLKPYHRLSRAGGFDGLSENCAGSDASQEVYGSVEDVTAGVLESHAAMLAEVPPHDGHRRAILDPSNTHVGIGLAFNRCGFRMTQEFLRRYVELTPPPREAVRAGAEVTLRGRVLSSAHTLKTVAVYFEPMPRPLSIDELQRTGSYGFPDEVSFEYPVVGFGLRYGDGSTGGVRVGHGGEFTCPVKLKRERPGLYTVCVWLEDERRNSIPATNLTLKVG